MFPESGTEQLITNPLLAIVAIAVVAVVIVLASMDRRYALFGYLVLLPLATMPMFSGRLVSIPGFSVQNVIAALGIYALLVSRGRGIRMDSTLRAALIAYWVAFAVVVLHGAFYLHDLVELRFFPPNYNIYYFLRNYLFMPFLVGLTFVLAYRYASSGAARALEFMRYLAIATIGFGVMVLGSAAYYSPQYSDFNVVRDMMKDFIGQHSNDYSLAFAMLAPFLLAGIMSRDVVSRGDRRLFMMTLVIAVLSVLFAYSRSGYLILLMSIFGLVLMAKRSLLWPLIAVTLVVILLAPESVMERAQHGFEPGSSELDLNRVSSGRLKMWEASINILANDFSKVILGGGRLTFTRSTFREFGVDTSHSAYFDVLLDAGIVGTIPILGLFILLFLRARGAQRRLRGSSFRYFYAAAVVTLTSYLLLATTGRSFFVTFPGVFIWQISGFVLGLYRFETSQRAHRTVPAAVSGSSPRSRIALSTIGNSTKCAG
jgi:O-antigen ligase